MLNLDFIVEQLKLRKLKVIDVQDKNRNPVKKMVIGFVHQGSYSFKVNTLINNPESNDDNHVSMLIGEEIYKFKNLFKDHFDEMNKILDKVQNNKKLFLFARGEFSRVLSMYGDNETKLKAFDQVMKAVKKKEQGNTKVREEELKIKNLIDQLQITEYHNYFSLARTLNRKLKLYIGPTNSGKTYHALNDLVAHEKGIYLSPLRLLAWEGKEEIEKRGKLVSLITGEEKVIVPDASFKAQTIETLNFQEVVGSILIDEVQMLYDEDRGWAWSQALIGSPCQELIMAGSPEAEPLVRKIAELLGEELEVIHLERFNPLEVQSKAYDIHKDINRIPEGSAVIAFSRKKVLEIKKLFESSGKSVSTIYGNLSPEVRKEEARKFREGKTKYLISTDAIAMGLNLPISTVIFSTIEKFNGTNTVSLTPMEIKQIAGRAGRYGKVEKGEVSAFNQGDLRFIKSFIHAEGEKNSFLYIKPSIEHVKKIGSELNTNQLFPILTFFTQKVMSSVGNMYVCANLDQPKEMAILLDKIKDLSLEDKFLFDNAPVPNEDHYHTYFNWIKDYQRNKKVSCPTINDLNHQAFRYDRQLILENYVKLLNLYSWLSYKKPEIFTELAKCSNAKDQSNFEIENLLSNRK